MFLSRIDPAFNRRIYRDYYHLYPFSHLETMNEAYRRPFERAFDLAIPGNGGRLLDIGCSDAAQLFSFQERGFDCVGISPGAKPSERVRMVDAYFEDVAFEPFDAIISRFNLEHVVDLKAFLAKVWKELVPGGRFVVQMPNPLNFMAAGMLNVFAHEHTQYFSPASLRCALERNDFEVEAVSAEGPSIIAVARRATHGASFLGLLSKTATLAGDVIAGIESHGDQPVVLYGAGLSLTGLLYGKHRGRLLKLKDRLTVVDDNQALWGKRLPLTDLRVHAFDPETMTNSVVFLLLNPIYHSRVVARVRCAAIYGLGSDGLKRMTK
jgi:2-polyprenyl-3-methyl-5-hydroxy-6-metoxy-1,4-benzoquinol methylase